MGTKTANPVGHFEIAGKSIGWHVTDRGWFQCVVAGEEVEALSLDALETKARQLVSRRKLRVQIPVTLINGYHDEIQTVYLTGINGRTRQVTTRDTTSGKADTCESYATCYRPFTPDEMKEYEALRVAAIEAEKARSSYLKKREMKEHARDLVQAAITKLEKERDTSEKAAS